MRPPTKDYYQILGVPRNAEETEIKKSFRKLAMEYHPDRNRNDPRTEEKFREITEAYGVLMDPSKRREYDLFYSGFYSGTQGSQNGSSQFRYSQQDIFENMFRQGFGRDIFEELNKEFQRQGYRSGSSFFEIVFFGGAAGGLGKILGMIPGPLGKLGQGLRILQMIGSSLLVLNRMSKSRSSDPAGAGEAKPEPSILGSVKGFFAKSLHRAGAEENLDVALRISILPEEAITGAKKKISYKVGDQTEQLAVVIPPGIGSGGKLRLKEKGLRKNDRRGDLILSVKVESP